MGEEFYSVTASVGGGRGSMVGFNGRAISLLCLLTTGVLLSTVDLVSLEERVNQF